MRTSLDWLLSLSGELKDGSESSVRFRQSIESEKVNLSDYQDWIGDALDGSGVQMTYAFQDLINALGKRLGADVEYGYYHGRDGGGEGYNGLWGIGMGRYIIVDSTTTHTYSVNAIRMEGLIAEVGSRKNSAPDYVAGLIVMGGADTGAMADAVYAEGLQKKVRVAVWKDLVRLIELRAEGVLTGSQIADLIFPFEAIDIGKMLSIVEPIARKLPGTRSVVEKYESDKSGELVLTDKREVPVGSPAEEIAYNVLAGSESKSPRRKVIVKRYIKKP